MKKRFDNKYFTLGLTAFLVIAGSVAVLVLLQNYSTVKETIGGFFRSISPVFYGLAFAYILNPAMLFFERHMGMLLTKLKLNKAAQNPKILRNLSIAATMFIAVLVIYSFFAMIVPQLTESLSAIASNLTSYFNNFQTWLSGLVEKYPELTAPVNTITTQLSGTFETWISEDFLPFFSGITTGLMSTVYGVFYIIIGLLISIYVLAGKENFITGSKKGIFAIFKPANANRILDVSRYANQVFGNFIIGKLVDSAIIGIICFLGMSILKLPYPLLISVVVGVTNIIPFFGPFLGAIPSTIFILVVEPIQALYFVIFILILQQVDGNVIGPRILGDATGVSSFWVIVSILIFSALFGVVGMIIAVPTFAVISMLIQSKIDQRLKKQGFEPDFDFLNVKAIDEDDGEFSPVSPANDGSDS